MKSLSERLKPNTQCQNVLQVVFINKLSLQNRHFVLRWSGFASLDLSYQQPH